MGELAGRLALVTGAGRGIGRAVAWELARAGADLLLAARTGAELVQIAAAIRAAGGRAEPVVADVRDPDQVAALFRAADAMGELDILVNNAGIARVRPFMETTPEEWRELFATNLDAVFHTTRAALARMLPRRHGDLVSIASDAAVKGIAGMVAYCATKHGLLGLDRALRLELRGSGVRLTTLLPGLVNTGILGGAGDRGDVVQPEDVAALVRRVVSLPPTAEVQELLLEPGPGNGTAAGGSQA
jgi:3-oxoacyl-[acyl-carrier protein] reductase